MGDGDFRDSRDFKFNNYLNRYHTRHCDLMDLLAMYTGRANAPLDDLAKMCGFPGKLGMDGGQVWQAYQNGEIENIRDYCETDVANTYLVYQRFRMMTGALSGDEYENEVEKLHEYLFSLSEDKEHWGVFLDAWGVGRLKKRLVLRQTVFIGWIRFGCYVYRIGSLKCCRVRLC